MGNILWNSSTERQPRRFPEPKPYEEEQLMEDLHEAEERLQLVEDIDNRERFEAVIQRIHNSNEPTYEHRREVKKLLSDIYRSLTASFTANEMVQKWRNKGESVFEIVFLLRKYYPYISYEYIEDNDVQKYMINQSMDEQEYRNSAYGNNLLVYD